MSRINADVVIALLLLVITSALYLDTYFYETVPGAIIGAKIWPRVVTFFIGGLSLLYLIQSISATRPEPKDDGEQINGIAEWFHVNRNVVACFAFYGLFLASLKWLGMLIGGILFVFVTLSYLGENTRRNFIINAIVAVVCMGFMWAIFTYALGVILPQGEILPR